MIGGNTGRKTTARVQLRVIDLNLIGGCGYGCGQGNTQKIELASRILDNYASI